MKELRKLSRLKAQRRFRLVYIVSQPHPNALSSLHSIETLSLLHSILFLFSHSFWKYLGLFFWVCLVYKDVLVPFYELPLWRYVLSSVSSFLRYTSLYRLTSTSAWLANACLLQPVIVPYFRSYIDHCHTVTKSKSITFRHCWKCNATSKLRENA